MWNERVLTRTMSRLHTESIAVPIVRDRQSFCSLSLSLSLVLLVPQINTHGTQKIHKNKVKVIKCTYSLVHKSFVHNENDTLQRTKIGFVLLYVGMLSLTKLFKPTKIGSIFVPKLLSCTSPFLLIGPAMY